MELTQTLPNKNQGWDIEEQRALNYNFADSSSLDKADLTNFREAIELYGASNSANTDLEASTTSKSGLLKVDNEPQDSDMGINLDTFSRQEPETKIYIFKAMGFFLAFIVGLLYLLITTKWKDGVSIMISISIIYLSYFAALDLCWKARLLKDIWVESDDFYKLSDIVSCLVFMIIANFRIADFLHTCYYSIFGFGISLFVYSYTSTTPFKKQFWEILPRSFYFVQALLIVLRADDFISSRLMLIFIPSWICCGILAAIYTKSLLDLMLKLIRNRDSTFTFKIMGFLWFFAYRVSILSLFGVLAGFIETQTSALESKFFILSIYCALALNISLFIWTLLARKFLTKFCIKFELVNCYLMMYTQDEFAKFIEKQKTITFEVQEKKNYFVMISQTYFIHLTNKVMVNLSPSSQDEDLIKAIAHLKGTNGDSSQDTQENNLCYVCYKNTSNAIFTNCGHGGICYDCASISIKEKDECLQCRGKIDAINIIDSNQTSSTVFKTVKTYNVVKI